jgi:hypothetical protein
MSNTSRHRRSPDRRRRRWGATRAGVAIAVGGAMAATSISTFLPTGTASADPDDFEQLVLTIDPNAFDAAGDPTDFLGTLASEVDADLANTVFYPELNTISEQAICALDPSCTDTLTITPPTTGDDGFTVLEQFVSQDYLPTAVPLVLVPGLDGDLATIAGQLDSYFADTVFGPEIYTVAEQIISGLTTAADPAAFVP